MIPIVKADGTAERQFINELKARCESNDRDVRQQSPKLLRMCAKTAIGPYGHIRKSSTAKRLSTPKYQKMKSTRSLQNAAPLFYRR